MCHSDPLIWLIKDLFQHEYLTKSVPYVKKSKIKFAYKSLITSWKLPGEFMSIKFKFLKITLCLKTISNPFSNDLSIMYLVNCNKGIYFSSIYTV